MGQGQQIRKPARRRAATNPVEAAAAADREQWSAERRLTAARIDAALVGLDREVERAERQWGSHGLLAAVSPQMAGKWAAAWSKLEAAIEANDADEVERRAAVCLRGLAAMQAEADPAKQPDAQVTWITATGGLTVGIVADNDAAHVAVRQRKRNGEPAALILSLQELANIAEERLNTTADFAAAAKAAFPGATIGDQKRQEAIDWAKGDRLPF